MVAKSGLKTSRRHVLLNDEDWEWLSQQYGPGGFKSHVGVSRAIRTIIHQRVEGMKARAAGIIDQLRDEQRPEGEPGVYLEGGPEDSPGTGETK